MDASLLIILIKHQTAFPLIISIHTNFEYALF